MTWWKTSHTCPVKVGDIDTDMRLICHEGLTEAFLLTLREPACVRRKRLQTWVEGVICACAVTGRVLLDAGGAPHLERRQRA